VKKLFCFGYGYTCDHLEHVLRSSGEDWEVEGTTRDPDKKADLGRRGIRAHVFDYTCPLGDPLYTLRDVTHLLISTPPGDEGDPAFMMHAGDIVELKNLEWVGYLSTTGVYGDRQGEWVDETSELRPSSKRGSRRVRAEEQWRAMRRAHDLPVHTFRLSGIYGPGRSALDSVRAGVARRIDKPGHAFGRIHVEDVARTLLTSMNNPDPGRVYNVTDDYPAPSHEVIAYACELLGLETPPLIPYEEADLAPIARSFYSDNKRVHNSRIKEDLGITLKYPDYRSGLAACLEAEQYALAELQSAGRL
jgi:hypothetical protein